MLQKFPLVEGLVGLFFPRICPGCGKSMFKHEQFLCTICEETLPFTFMENSNNNYLHKRLAGRVPLVNAAAMLRFSRGSTTQNILHAIKYRGNKDLANYMGQIFGVRLGDVGLLRNDQVLVPVPLHPHKLQIRGYNQSEEIANGIAGVLSIKVDANAMIRVQNHLSQTRKNREQRWDEIKSDFKAVDFKVKGKDVVLVDDVCTTGATVEACAQTLLECGCSSVSLLTLAVAGGDYQ